MAVEALCTVFTVPGVGQHRIDARYLYGAPDRPAHGCYEVTCDHVYVGEVWHDQDADPWPTLMAKAAEVAANTMRAGDDVAEAIDPATSGSSSPGADHG